VLLEHSRRREHAVALAYESRTTGSRCANCAPREVTRVGQAAARTRDRRASHAFGRSVAARPARRDGLRSSRTNLVARAAARVAAIPARKPPRNSPVVAPIGEAGPPDEQQCATQPRGAPLVGSIAARRLFVVPTAVWPKQLSPSPLEKQLRGKLERAMPASWALRDQRSGKPSRPAQASTSGRRRFRVAPL
jgi:hypothetical protein